MIASLTGAAVGGTPVDAQTGGAVGQNAVENNLYLTSEALKKDKQTARKIYSVIKEQVKHECSSTGRITECRQNIGRIIEFTQDKRFDSRFKDLKKESLYYLNKHPDLVASYLKAEYEKLDREDKSILHRYISPGAEIVSGSLGVVLSMFPKDWDEARIRAEVTSAWESRIMLKDNKWQGTSKSGIKIEGFTEPNRTAYPIYE
ncbi:TPA: EndoU domain-containing protein [Neisseria meningitidis]